MSHAYPPSPYSDPTMETVSPLQFQVQDTQGQDPIPSAPSSDILDKPIVIPQSTNLRFMPFMKNLSPFARCFPYSLSTLSNPITESEFLAFIDRLNHVFVSLPIFQVAHIAGGVLCSVQGVIPAQAIGGVLQVTSLLASAGVTFVRVRKFLKSANADIFAPRGLICRIMTTEKMMARINFSRVDKRAKLKLPPLETIHDLGISHSYSAPVSISSEDMQTNSRIETATGVKDPRLLRLQALEGYIAPLDFNVSESSPPESRLSKIGQKPLNWANNRQMKALEKAHRKWLKSRDLKAPTSSAPMPDSSNTSTTLNTDIEILHQSQENYIQGSGHSSARLEELQMVKREEEKKKKETMKETMKETYGGVDKMEKAYKKEEKVANRILWIVIAKVDGTPVEEESLFRVESETSTPEVSD